MLCEHKISVCSWMDGGENIKTYAYLNMKIRYGEFVMHTSFVVFIGYSNTLDAYITTSNKVLFHLKPLITFCGLSNATFSMILDN